MKRFHLNDSDVDKAMLHLDAIDNLRRYPKMSVAPKLHVLSVHLLRFLERVQVFGDFRKDSGEREHQEESRDESRVGAVVNIAIKERTKSQFEAMKKSAMVKETMIEFKQK